MQHDRERMLCVFPREQVADLARTVGQRGPGLLRTQESAQGVVNSDGVSTSIPERPSSIDSRVPPADR